MIIKVCGLRDAANIRQVAALDVDLLGLIFAPASPRCVTRVPQVSVRQGRAGVFVDAPFEQICSHVRRYGLTHVQLHGHEPVEVLHRLRRALPGVRLIKALPVRTVADVQASRPYVGEAHLLLFDARGPLSGGNGTQFDWSVLQAYQGATPFLLSGGIGPGDARRVARFSHPRCAGIDLNSRFETAPAVKDVALLAAFINQLKQETKTKTKI